MDNEPNTDRRSFFKSIGDFLYDACSSKKDSLLYGFGERKELNEKSSLQEKEISGLRTQLHNQEFNYLEDIKQLIQRLTESQAQYQEDARANLEQISQLEKKLELTFGLVRWKEQRITELRKEWFGSLSHLLNYVFREEPYVLINNRGIISQVSQNAKLLFRYGPEAIGKHYSAFVDKTTENKAKTIGRQFLRGEEGEAYVEKISLDFYKNKKIKVNATVFPCVGPRDEKGRDQHAGYLLLFDRPSLRFFNKNKGAKSYAKKMIGEINAFLKKIDKRIYKEKLEELNGQIGLAAQPA